MKEDNKDPNSDESPKENPEEEPLQPGQFRDKHGIVRELNGHFVKGAASPNPGGRIKGERTFPSLLNQYLAMDNLDSIDMAGLSVKDKLVIGWIKNAMLDDKAKVLEGIVNRLEGTPVATQKVDLTTHKNSLEYFLDKKYGDDDHDSEL